jgi:3-oxoadipate enol-lactonase
MPIADINGLSLHYRSEGDPHKPCVVLSNSLGTDLSMWDAQAEALAPHFHVLRYDTRGHGASGSPPGPYSVQMLGQDVAGLLDHLRIGQAHFCGLSMGGVIGQWLAIHAPQRLRKLVLANTAGKVGTQEGWNSRARAVRQEGLDAIADGAAGRWFSPGFIAARPATIAAMLDKLRRQDAEGYASCCDALASADLRGAIHAIAAPTLIIAGTLDPVTTVSDAMQMQQAIFHADVATVDAAHLSNIEAELAFTGRLLDFLRAD